MVKEQESKKYYTQTQETEITLVKNSLSKRQTSSNRIFTFDSDIEYKEIEMTPAKSVYLLSPSAHEEIAGSPMSMRYISIRKLSFNRKSNKKLNFFK
ncbi:hypothetical protein A0H76_15 [Hepatospora eriocheir]|uniref:Uncharacterized protein n=1 Tax=Hepatospora eriocheir TaxID=1081669 RepID=A0A1X0QLL1_9MICR|nr:hypothetical protein A0H76_15 [Hepatospora eriocheir]